MDNGFNRIAFVWIERTAGKMCRQIVYSQQPLLTHLFIRSCVSPYPIHNDRSLPHQNQIARFAKAKLSQRVFLAFAHHSLSF